MDLQRIDGKMKHKISSFTERLVGESGLDIEGCRMKVRECSTRCSDLRPCGELVLLTIGPRSVYFLRQRWKIRELGDYVSNEEMP